MTPADCTTDTQRDCRDQFRRVDEKLSAIHAMLVEMRTVNESQEQRIGRTEKTLFGNGHVGLATKVSAILWIASAIAGFLVVIVAESIAAWVK